ncbi:MAG: hypothetical protein ACKVI4_17185, partial [Actinomycetales bacterium]
AADACGTDAEQSVYDANNLCDDWSTIVVQGGDGVGGLPTNKYWWSYEAGELYFYYDEDHSAYPEDPGFDGHLPDPTDNYNQASHTTPNFNDNSICEDGMGASRVEGVNTAPHGGYWIQLYTTDQAGTCSRSLLIDGVSYVASGTILPNGFEICHIYYAPCPAGGDCADCGRGATFGNGDGATRPTGDPVSTAPATAAITTDLVQPATYGAAPAGGLVLPPIRTGRALMDLLNLVKDANASGSLLGMNMPSLFTALFMGELMTHPNGTTYRLRVRV